MRKRLLFIVLLLSACVGSVLAQKKEITGKVLDAVTGEPVSGVTVVTDKKNSTITRPDGTYAFRVDSAAAFIIFSHVNYATQSLEISGRTVIDAQLAVATNTMEDVVVIGYGTVRKSHLTGAVSKLKTDRIEETPSSRLDQALQGKIAGVRIQNITSEAGADPKIQVRGVASISAGSNPLVVVDGHPIPDGLAFVNMADVESVEVLKDAASAAIYGSRGATGVIMITTKSGKSDRPKYNFKASTGAKTAYKLYPMMSVTEYANLLFYEAALKAKDPSITPPTGTGIIANNERAMYVIENTLMGGTPTNWQEQAIRPAAVHNLQLNISGGKKDVKYYISGGYQKDQGMMYHSEYDRFSLRTKMDAQLSKRTHFSFNLNPSYIKRERPSVNYIDFVRFYSYLPVYHTAATAAFVNQAAQWAHIKPGDFAQARHFNGRPYSGLMPDGTLWTSTGNVDPFSTSNNTPKSIMETRTITSNDYRVQSSGDITLNIIPGLDLKSMLSAYVSYSNVLDFAKRNANKDGDLSRGQYNNRLNVDLLNENTLTYNRKIKDHSFNVLLGYTLQRIRSQSEQSVGLDYLSDNITTLNTALQIDQANTFNTKGQVGLNSLLARVIYNFRSKYLLTASIRRDGSSNFGEGRKWGTFPAVSLGWMTSEEKFLQKADWITSLKLRASYGLLGNNSIPEFAYLDLLYTANYPLGGQTGTANPGQAPSRTIQGNPDLTWERTYSINGGMDLSLFKNLFNLTLDIYRSKTDQLLLQQNAMGFTGVPQFWNNIGRMQNDGVEVELTANIFRNRNFKWTASGNVSRVRPKLVALGGESLFSNQGERTEVYLNLVGERLIQYYGYKTDGVWLSQAEIDQARAAGLNAQLSNLFVPGGLKLVDFNGDKVIDANDRTVIGDPYPNFTWGLNNSVSYKAFDLTLFVQGSQGGQLINGDPNYNETKRINKNYTDNRWLSPANPGDGKTPYSTLGFNWMLTDYVVEDASYYAIRELVVGFTLPQKFAKAVRLSSARFYFSAQNIYYHWADGYRGINPEARFTTGPYNTPLVDGYQRGSFPLPKTIMFGLDINF